MWISQQSVEFLATVIRWHPCRMFFTDATGKILWANKEFVECIGYSLNELQKTTVQAINILSSDIMQDDYTQHIGRLSDIDPTASIRTQIRPKQSHPEWGILHLRLHHAVQEDRYWCVWEPMQTATDEAFVLAIEKTKETAAAMQQLQAEIRQVTQRDQDEDWIVSTIRMARKYPKTAIAFVVLLASTLGLNSVLEMAQRLGIIGLPTVPTNPQATQPQTGLLSDPYQYPQYAGQKIGSHPQAFTVTTKSGSIIEWENGYAGLQRGTGYFRSGSGRLRRGDRSSGYRVGVPELPFAGVDARHDEFTGVSAESDEDTGRF